MQKSQTGNPAGQKGMFCSEADVNPCGRGGACINVVGQFRGRPSPQIICPTLFLKIIQRLFQQKRDADTFQRSLNVAAIVVVKPNQPLISPNWLLGSTNKYCIGVAPERGECIQFGQLRAYTENPVFNRCSHLSLFYSR